MHTQNTNTHGNGLISTNTKIFSPKDWKTSLLKWAGNSQCKCIPSTAIVTVVINITLSSNMWPLDCHQERACAVWCPDNSLHAEGRSFEKRLWICNRHGLSSVKQQEKWTE